jgi:hypothetical protein
MRRSRSHLVVLVTLATALVASGATGSAANDARPKATVTVSGVAPMIVTGAGFLPRERVMVRITLGVDSFRRAPRANANGRFAVQFEPAAVVECSNAAMVILTGTIVATGNRSDRTARTRIRSIRIPPPCGIAPQP